MENLDQDQIVTSLRTSSSNDETNFDYYDDIPSVSHCYASLAHDPVVRFLLGGIVMGLTCLIGMIGNVLSVVVLTRPTMISSSTNIILLGLSCCDLLLVTATFLLYVINGVVNYFCVWTTFNDTYYPHIFPRANSIFSTSQYGSIYFTMAITIERYIVVYWPLHARRICTFKNAVWTSIAITLFSILYNLPTWFAYTTIPYYPVPNPMNLTYYTSILTEMAKTEAYQLYYITWSDNIFAAIVPFTLLIVLNTSVYLKIRQTNKLRRTMTQTETNEIDMSKMLLAVVTLFILCYTPPLVHRMRSVFGYSNPEEFNTVVDFTVCLNSALNFFIYCFMGTKFRETLKKLIPRCSIGSPSLLQGSRGIESKDTLELQLPTSDSTGTK